MKAIVGGAVVALCALIGSAMVEVRMAQIAEREAAERVYERMFDSALMPSSETMAFTRKGEVVVTWDAGGYVVRVFDPSVVVYRADGGVMR